MSVPPVYEFAADITTTPEYVFPMVNLEADVSLIEDLINRIAPDEAPIYEFEARVIEPVSSPPEPLPFVLLIKYPPFKVIAFDTERPIKSKVPDDATLTLLEAPKLVELPS
jgi:hypothetical protein